jgi:hypothetical protein
MPAQPSWHLRVPQIRAALEAPAAPPFLDRPAIETLFGLRRRQAIRILTACGGYQVGKTFLASREALLQFIGQAEASGGVERMAARRNRISAALTEAARQSAARQTQVRTAPDLLIRQPSGLPGGVRLAGPGALEIRYDGATDLLGRIAELAAAAANDFPRFRRLFEGAAE